MRFFSKNPLMMISILTCTAAIFSVPAYFIYQNVINIVVGELGKSAIGIAATISEFTEFNFDNYQNIPLSSFENFDTGITLPSEETPPVTYPDLVGDSEAGSQQAAEENAAEPSLDPFPEKLGGVFTDLMQATGAQAIYIERKLSEENKAYLFNQNDLDKSRYYGSSKLTEEELTVFNEGISVPSSLMNNVTVGNYIAGYAPIKNPSSGKVVGTVVVELSLNHAQTITAASAILSSSASAL
jgi:hypothetical protein